MIFCNERSYFVPFYVFEILPQVISYIIPKIGDGTFLDFFKKKIARPGYYCPFSALYDTRNWKIGINVKISSLEGNFGR